MCRMIWLVTCLLASLYGCWAQKFKLKNIFTWINCDASTGGSWLLDSLLMSEAILKLILFSFFCFYK